MIQSSEEIALVARESQREARKQARRRLFEAVLTGKQANMADVAVARGLVLRERDNSIFSDAWIPLAVVFFLVGLLANRNSTLLALGSVLLIVVWVSTQWKNVALLGVTYLRSFDRTRVFPGEAIEMTITVANDKILPLSWAQFRDELPIAPPTESRITHSAAKISGRYILQNSFSLHGRGKAQRTIKLRFPSRGYYSIGPVTYESGDLFTLFTIERAHHYIDTLVVYPQIWPLEQLGLPAKEPFGEVRVRRSLFTDPIRTQGIREYRPRDRFRDVHWKATARRGKLQTRVFDPSTGMAIAVFLNVATYPKHWMGFDPELLERAVSVAGSIANFGVEQGWGVGVYANGSVPGSDQPIRVPPGRSHEQLNRILEALAAVTEFATGGIDLMMYRESPNLPWAATMVLVTSIVTDEMIVCLIRLKEAGRRVVLVSLSDQPLPPHMGNIPAYHIPMSVPAFQAGRSSYTADKAVLSAIPTPVPVSLGLEEIEGASPQESTP